MKKIGVRLLFGLFIIGLYCCSGNESNSTANETTNLENDNSEISEEIDAVRKPESKTSSRKEGEQKIPFVERTWKNFCKYPAGNIEFVMQGNSYILSCCDGDYQDDDWFQYLLLKDSDQSKTTYDKIVVEKRASLPKQLDDYYGYPNFTASTVDVADVDGDGREEIIIGIHVSGKSSGAGTEEESYWDEDFYEIYIMNGNSVKFSSYLTGKYIRPEQEMENTLYSSGNEITALLVEISGDYNQGSWIDGKLHSGKCYGFSINIMSKDGGSVWMDQIMDGYAINVVSFKGKPGSGNYKLNCHEPPPPEEDGFALTTMEYKTENDVHYFVTGEKQGFEYFVLEADENKIPEDPEECETEEEY